VTLILALGNPDYTIQLSDRRLTLRSGKPGLDENKATLVTCKNARLLMGFSGLASTTGHRTAEWLLEILAEAAPPDDLAEAIIHRFVRLATEAFSCRPLSRVSREDRRLSVMFSGYGYWTEPPLQIAALVSNFQDFESHRDAPEAWNEFRPFFLWEKRPPVGEAVATYVQRIGAWPVLGPQEVAPLRTMLQERRPAEAVVGKAVEVMREAAAHPAARGTIGEDLSSAVIRPDPANPTNVGYHVTRPVHDVPMINQAILLGKERGRILMRDAVVGAPEPAVTPPLLVQKVGRNRPCPCGSGKKYKRCHGRQPPAA
jgi:hypothetical protein